MSSSGSGDDSDKMNPNDAKKKVVEFAPRPVTATGSINRAREILNATCVAALVSKQDPEDLTPLAPRLLCDILGEACKDMQVMLEIKLIILKMFERKVMDELETVYIEANRVLIEAGVLPHLKYTLPKNAR